MCQHDDGWVVVLGEKGRLEYILCLHYISRKGHCFDDTYIQYHITAGYSHRGITHIKHIAVYTNKNYDISSPSTIGEGGVERRAV